ncbi:MAG: RidA family protein [Vicinamibacterales bacterium]
MMQPNPLKEIVNIGPPPGAPYSRAVKAGGLIYLSGMLAEDGSGTIAGIGDVAAQTRRILERVREVLSAAGSSLEQALSVTVYLKSASDFQAMNDAYRPLWPKDPPTRTTVITDLVLEEALVEITVVAAPAGAERVVIHPDGWMQSPNPYNYAIRSGDTLFLSGLVSRNGRDNSVVTGDITVQTRAVMDNASELLKAAGLSFAHVVSTRVYLTDAANFQGMNEVYRHSFSHGFPARATVKAGLAGPVPLVEMTFTASSTRREVFGTPPEGVPISPAIRAGERLYLSGALGNTPETSGNAGAQTRETLARLRNTLASAGASPADVVEGTVYLKEVAAFAAMNEQYRAFFGSGFPARTTVGTPLVVDDGLVEIMLTAVVPPA